MRSEIEVRTDLINKANEISTLSKALDAEKPTKVGKKRLRLLTLELEKLGKEYRKVSVK